MSGQPDARAELEKLLQVNQVEAAEDLDQIRPDMEIDVTGEVCPYPVVAATRALAKLKPGQVLAELTDHTISTHTVPSAVESQGLAKVLGIRQVGPGLYQILMRKL